MEKEIKKIPGDDGWWKTAAEEYFNETAKKMVDNGFSEQEALDILSNIYWHVADCYGGC